MSDRLDQKTIKTLAEQLVEDIRGQQTQFGDRADNIQKKKAALSQKLKQNLGEGSSSRRNSVVTGHEAHPFLEDGGGLIDKVIDLAVESSVNAEDSDIMGDQITVQQREELKNTLKHKRKLVAELTQKLKERPNYSPGYTPPRPSPFG
jgi:ABC-type Zn uptake system ZnuABC Zn-binding protein ZnuA